MKRLTHDSGQTLIFVALGMSVLLGFAAFATDIGVMLHERDKAQTAADSAAIAGAKSLHYGAASVQAAAIRDASLNGFTDGSNGVTVTVSNPPTTDQVGNAIFAAKGYVKVSILENTPGFFMRVFGINAMPVAASATATNGAPSQNCFYIVNPSAPDAMNLQGSFDVSVPDCGIVIDSTSSDALHFQGAAGHLTAGSVEVVGGDSGQTGDSTPAPVLGVASQADPLSWEPTQTVPNTGCTGSGNYTLTGTATAGCYGDGTGTITLSNVQLGAGLYIFNGPVSLSGSVTGTGVTLYLANGGLSATTNSTLDLVAPTSATPTNPYNGILIDDQGTNTIELEMGNATGTLTGVMYAPNAQLYVHDSGGDSSGGTGVTGTNALDLNVDLVVNTFNDQTGDLTINPYSKTFGAGTSPLTKVTLVE